jgi:hypothetical protein
MIERALPASTFASCLLTTTINLRVILKRNRRPYVRDLTASGRIGIPNLIICLDSGAGNYEQLWITASLRGVVAGELKVEIISEGVHSGDAAGVVPDTFRIARSLLDRVEDAATGNVLLPELQPHMSVARKTQVKDAATVRAVFLLISIRFELVDQFIVASVPSRCFGTN